MAQITKCKSNTYSFKATETRKYYASDQAKTKDWRDHDFFGLDELYFWS